MYKNILIPTDGSSLSASAIKQGVALAKSVGARVTGITVSAPFHTFALDPLMVSDTSDQYKKDIEDRAERFLGAIKAAAKSAGVRCEVEHVMAEHPYEGIIDAAKKADCDLIFMASHGRKGVSALVLGSETVKVLTHSKTPVLVCR
jgi:nucleotide-binding universal stress UspA family protein